jgi:hypothetical protein
MRHLILTFLLFFASISANGQSFFGDLYDDFLKYGSLYGAADFSSSYEEPTQTYFVRTNPDGGLYDIPTVVNNTPSYPFDYRIGFGIRKLARFNYERKPKNYYDGTESQLAFTAPTSAFQGLEYQIHFENERLRGMIFQNHRFFVKHTGKYHIVKADLREVGKINLKYSSAEVRARLPIGKKFSISAGAIVRGHDRPYGYNPIEIWLNEETEDGGALNPWYTLGFEYGYDDIYYTSTDENGNELNDWYWIDELGNRVADTDLEFRETVFIDLMNRYNKEVWSGLDAFVEIAPIVGFDFYHFKNKFWLHAYGNYILPNHKYIKGDEMFSYLNRNNWGKGGLKQDSTPEQWNDYSAGVSFGWKLGKSIGVFAEGEFTKMWDSELFQSTVGINYTFK